MILAGLLTYLHFFTPSHFDNSGMWKKKFCELTAAGTVQDLHLIPY